MQINNFAKLSNNKIIQILLTVFFTLCLNSCSEKNGSKNNYDMARPVQIGKAIKYDIPVYVENIGTLVAINNVDIVSQVTGKILECHFTQGQFVKRGDLLFTIDSRPYRALLDEAYAALKEDEQDKKLQAYILEKDKYLPDSGAIAKQSFVQFVSNFNKTLAKIELDKATIYQYKIQVEYCKITSPIDGITGFRRVDPGNIVTANDGPALVNIRSIDPLYVDFTIPEKYFMTLKDAMAKGQLKAIIKTAESNIDNETLFKYYNGTLHLLNNFIDPTTGTIQLRATVPNKDHSLWPGQFVNVELIFFIKKNALLVPYQSVQQGLKGYYVFVIKNNRAELQLVKPGLQEGGYMEITPLNKDSIKPGDDIVTVGQMGLAPGVTVKIIKRGTFELPPHVIPLTN